MWNAVEQRENFGKVSRVLRKVFIKKIQLIINLIRKFVFFFIKIDKNFQITSVFLLTNLFQVIFDDVYADKKAVRNKIPINPGMLKHVTVINLTFEVNF